MFGAPPEPTAQDDRTITVAPQPPLPHQYTSRKAWLRAWVEFRRARHPPGHFDGYDKEIGQPSVSLTGSLGTDSAMNIDGEVWVQFGIDEDDLDGWRPAHPNERFALLVSAQRLYPELAVLLPRRPVKAVDCPECEGTGRIPGFDCWCPTC